MYLPLRKEDHITDEDGLVHRVTSCNKALFNEKAKQVVSNAYTIACRPSHQLSLVGREDDGTCPQITNDHITCLACLASQ